MSKFKDLTGLKFGILTVVKRVESTKNWQSRWLCLCQCGCTTIRRSDGLNNGNSTSCGCTYTVCQITHGYSCRDKNKPPHPLYILWLNMKKRCSDDIRFYRYYKKRGIDVCCEWEKYPTVFIKWCLENGWREGLELDRRDNDNGYSPDNCRFVSHKINMNNTRLITSSNTTGFAGVSKKKHKYRSYYWLNNNTHNIGSFSTAKVAAIARDLKLLHLGLGRKLNFPELIHAIS